MAAHAIVCRATLFGGVLLCLLAAPPLAAAAEDPAEEMYRPDTVDAIDLELPPASVQALEEDPEGDYVEGTFSLAQSDGTPSGVGPFSAPLTVGIRLKGGTGSFRELKDEKAAFKIKFNEFVKGQKFLGLKKMTLNNMVQDPSMLHETLTYEAFGSLGVPASRTGYAYVRVNGADYGVYLNIETLDDVFLPRWFGSTRHLYEADAPGLDVTPGSVAEFEVDEGDDEDLSDLEALIAAAGSEAGDWSDGMAAVANLEEMTRMWAVERYVGHWDGYAGVAAPFRPNNYYLHSEDTGPGAGVFQMLPWGTDQTWEDRVEFDEPAGGLMFNECFADESCAALYREALRAAGAEIPLLDLEAQASCLAERLAPWQAMEDSERREYDAGEIEAGVAGVLDFVAERPGELADWLATQPPPAEEPSGHASAAPCEAPEPETEPESPGGSSGSAATAPIGSPALGKSAIRIDRLSASSGVLTTRLRLAQPGWLHQIAEIEVDGDQHRACTVHPRLRPAGKATLRCSLSALARRHLRSRWLKLAVTIRFWSEGGGVVTIRRGVAAPRLGA